MLRVLAVGLAPVLAAALPLCAAEYYVAPSGSDSNPGSKARPFRTIQRAIDGLQPGDTCYLRAGTYHEEVLSRGRLQGTAEKPIAILSYAGEKVLLDGSEAIAGKWTRYRKNIYKTTVANPVWQLFVDGEMMIMARWPNAGFTDGSIWDQKGHWAQGDVSKGSINNLVDAPRGALSLAGSGLDATGAMAILNIGSFRTWARKVTGHGSGSDAFTFNPIAREGYRAKLHYYYLECALNLLDAEREWYYDHASKTLYLWAAGDAAPRGEIRGKTQSYAFNIHAGSHVRIAGLNFFATCLRFENCTHMTVEDCDLMYPSCSKRMLGSEDAPEATLIQQPASTSPSFCTVRNCSFENTDGHALYMMGDGNVVENCSFRNIDFSVASLPGLMISVNMDGINGIFRRNTLEKCGASSTVKPGIHAIVELNRISRTGFLQSDGAMIHCTKPEQPGIQIRYNWCHDSVKYGIRFDGMPGATNGAMHHNVTWKVEGGLMVKGDRQRIFNNTGFDNDPKNDIMALADPEYGGNAGSVFRNNAAGKLAGHRTADSSRVPIPGIHDHNWNGYVTASDIRTQLRDPDNLDFRPRRGSELVDAGYPIDGVTDGYLGKAPDIGAYEFSASNYWIPGRQLTQASTPIPPDGAGKVKRDADLMWLEGYRADSHDVYFGTDREAVAAATRSSKEFRGNSKTNIFTPGALKPGAVYYWRIDAVRDGRRAAGEVWNFELE